jgi:hypothetical protein
VRQPTAEQFLKDVANHKMTIALDSGDHRHVRFRQERNSNLWFDLVTWPGFLTICGDMGTWTFARVEDMFTFFRSRGELKINASYWAEKLQNGVHGGSDQSQVFDFDTFKAELLDQIEGYGLEDAKAAELREVVGDEITETGDRGEAYAMAREFRHESEDGETFEFDPCELPDGKVYRYHFIWCLYAIVWGIQQYDARKERAA